MKALSRETLLDRVAAHGARHEETFLDAWFRPETRPLLSAAARRLRPH